MPHIKRYLHFFRLTQSLKGHCSIRWPILFIAAGMVSNSPTDFIYVGRAGDLLNFVYPENSGDHVSQESYSYIMKSPPFIYNTKFQSARLHIIIMIFMTSHNRRITLQWHIALLQYIDNNIIHIVCDGLTKPFRVYMCSYIENHIILWCMYETDQSRIATLRFIANIPCTHILYK